ncbi:hypothetical protein QP970_04440 [Corynebacterium sp. MSK073]|uniref:hypothetical protein n=1 Tax=Corynebacterium sp. MSK073 TaxID=3050198 RepID=UPI0025505057|nr:hypothetical protein [Corynebacterium sp. MSK073]MDK8814613.1 hypothetical protein [Corynebacterium sp. MSK073]
MKKPNDSFFVKLMQGLFAFFVLHLFQKVFPENERVEESECENREGGEEKKSRWVKLKKAVHKFKTAVGKPAYGNIALIIIQILLYAVTSAATLQQEWFKEAKPIALGSFAVAWIICVGIYCVASDGAMVAFFCLLGICLAAGALAMIDLSGLKDPVTYVLQLGLQSASLICAAFASRYIKSVHTGS